MAFTGFGNVRSRSFIRSNYDYGGFGAAPSGNPPRMSVGPYTPANYLIFLQQLATDESVAWYKYLKNNPGKNPYKRGGMYSAIPKGTPQQNNYVWDVVNDVWRGPNGEVITPEQIPEWNSYAKIAEMKYKSDQAKAGRDVDTAAKKAAKEAKRVADAAAKAAAKAAQDAAKAKKLADAAAAKAAREATKEAKRLANEAAKAQRQAELEAERAAQEAERAAKKAEKEAAKKARKAARKEEDGDEDGDYIPDIDVPDTDYTPGNGKKVAPPPPPPTPYTIAGFDLSANWPILAILGVGAFLILRGKKGKDIQQEQERGEQP